MEEFLYNYNYYYYYYYYYFFHSLLTKGRVPFFGGVGFRDFGATPPPTPQGLHPER